MKDINKEVDRLLKSKKRSSRIYNPKMKLVYSIGTTLILVGLIAGASLFSVFVDQTHDITVDSYLFWDEQPMGDLIATDNINGYGGETVEFTHNISYIATDNGAIPLEFEIIGEAATDGTITGSIWYNNTEITNLTVYPDNIYEITVKYYIHPYAVPDTYSINLSVTLGE